MITRRLTLWASTGSRNPGEEEGEEEEGVEGVEGVGKGKERVSGCAACMSHSNRVLSSPLQEITQT